MKKLFLVLPLLALTACGSILPKGPPAPKLYTLNAPTVTRAAGPSARTLQILAPQTAPGLETERIALRPNANSIDYFADSKWAATPPALLQSLLVETFDSSGALRSTGNDLVALKGDNSLLIEIRDFQVEYSNTTPVAHIRYIAKLIDNETNTAVTTTSYEENQKASSSDLDNIVAAFDTANQRAVTRIVQDTIQFIQSDSAPPASAKIILTPPKK